MRRSSSFSVLSRTQAAAACALIFLAYAGAPTHARVAHHATRLSPNRGGQDLAAAKSSDRNDADGASATINPEDLFPGRDSTADNVAFDNAGNLYIVGAVRS